MNWTKNRTAVAWAGAIQTSSTAPPPASTWPGGAVNSIKPGCGAARRSTQRPAARLPLPGSPAALSTGSAVPWSSAKK
jgi:hypothetical protein